MVATFAALGAPRAQPASPQPTTLAPYLRFDRVNGMAKGAVKAIVQDSAGFMWFGTDEGLSRYDGYEYVNYVPGANTEDTLANFTVTSLAASESALWIGTVKGLDRLDLATKKFTHFKANPKDPKALGSDYITSLFIDKGTLWIGTNDAGVYAMAIASGEIRGYRSDKVGADAVSDDAITVVSRVVDGKVWIGTRESGVKVLDPDSGKVVRYGNDKAATSLSSDEVTSIYQDQEGTVWVGTLNGLNDFDGTTRTFKRHFQDAESTKAISSIAGGVDGALWLGLRGTGVLRFDRHSGAVEHYIHDGNDPTSIVNALTWVAYSDRGGVLWFGGDAGGASKLSLTRRQFTYYRTNPGLAFYEEGDLVWLGTLGAGLRSFNTKTGEVKHYLDEQLGATYTIKIVPGGNGTLWIGTTDAGLFHFTPRTGQFELFDKENGALHSDAVVALLPDHDNLWFGTFGGGLVRFDPARRTAEYFANNPANADSLSSDAVSAIYQDRTRSEILWVGTSEGLNAFDKRTGKVVRYLHDPAKPTSLSHDHVTDIYQDHGGRTWVATWGGGLDKFDPKTGTFVAYHANKGIASDVVYGIMEDKTAALWLTTNNGLTRFNPDLETATTFRAGDGLQDDEFGQGAFYQGLNGKLYVGGPNGFNVFLPENVKIDAYAPPVVMTSFSVLGEARPVTEKVALSYRDRWFSVSFAALAFADPELNRYRYRLTGFHDWVETKNRVVSYSSLPPGNYTLEVVGSNAHGVWAKHGMELAIHVPPPPWRTWWAFTLYGLVVLMTLGFLYRRHRGQLAALTNTHRLLELERELALTSAVQEGFFPPDRSIRDHNLRVEAFYRAAAQCGGDWWTCESRPGHAFVIVGDATGHGVGSAMVTAAAASSFRSLGSKVDTDTRFNTMNEEVLRVSRGQYHMTLTAVDINLETGDYTVVSLGGVPVFALAPDSRVRVLMCPGTPLGSETFEIGKLQDRLAPGERLLILTDGISEVPLANQQLLGPRGVGNFFTQTRDQEIETALAALVRKVEDVNASAQDDDWTVVMIQWGAKTVEISEPSTVVGSQTQTRSVT